MKFILTSEILSYFDQSTKPCDDFYQFSCGGFLKKTFVNDGQVEAGPSVDEANYIQYFLKDRLANEQLMSSYSKVMEVFFTQLLGVLKSEETHGQSKLSCEVAERAE